MWTDKEETQPSDKVKEDALKLVKTGMVHSVGYCPVYVVNGNLDEYHVILAGDEEYFCTCPATRICKHVLAARQVQGTQVD